MSVIETVEFIFRFELGIFALSSWLWAVLAVLAIFVAAACFGKLWNRDWSLARHWGNFSLIAGFSLLGGFAALTVRSTDRVSNWITDQQRTLPQILSQSERLQRSSLAESWGRLAQNGGQEGLIPPGQSGDQLRLNDEEEATTFAQIVGEETRSHLRTKPPFSFGLTPDTLTPKEIGVKTLDLLHTRLDRYPIVVGSDNDWTRTAVAIQTKHAIESAQAEIAADLKKLRLASTWLLAIAITIPLVTTTLRALDDIKSAPKR